MNGMDGASRKRRKRRKHRKRQHAGKMPHAHSRQQPAGGSEAGITA
jgi:hypothetical protein